MVRSSDATLHHELRQLLCRSKRVAALVSITPDYHQGKPTRLPEAWRYADRAFC